MKIIVKNNKLDKILIEIAKLLIGMLVGVILFSSIL